MIDNFFKRLKGSLIYEWNYYKLKKMSPHKYPDYLKKEYRKRTGEDLDIKNPTLYTEKMQYAKIHNYSRLKGMLSDKYEVRNWVEKKIGRKYLIPLIGVYDKYSEINFKLLPEQFVLKLNVGSGTNVVVRNKNQLNYFETKLKFERMIRKDYSFSNGLELHYQYIEPKIIIEKYVVDKNEELNDYKFLCFNGKVYYCWVDVGRFSTHYRNVYDLDWNLQPWKQHTYNNTPYKVKKPENFDEMIHIASKLCEGFSHVRVDLYNVDGRIYFGEMTFTNGSGYELIYPEKYNEYLGDLWELNNDSVF